MKITQPFFPPPNKIGPLPKLNLFGLPQIKKYKKKIKKDLPKKNNFCHGHGHGNGATIRIGSEIQFLPYADFFSLNITLINLKTGNLGVAIARKNS